MFSPLPRRCASVEWRYWHALAYACASRASCGLHFSGGVLRRGRGGGAASYDPPRALQQPLGHDRPLSGAAQALVSRGRRRSGTGLRIAPVPRPPRVVHFQHTRHVLTGAGTPNCMCKGFVGPPGVRGRRGGGSRGGHPPVLPRPLTLRRPSSRQAGCRLCQGPSRGLDRRQREHKSYRRHRRRVPPAHGAPTRAPGVSTLRGVGGGGGGISERNCGGRGGGRWRPRFA